MKSNDSILMVVMVVILNMIMCNESNIINDNVM